MKQQEIFGDALWLSGYREEKNENVSAFSVLRGRFYVEKIQKATLYVLGLGFFYCYINGQRVGDDLYLPLSTDYEARVDYPKDEVMSGHRIYVPSYDITHLLREGENSIAIHFGGGWYTYEEVHTAKSRFGYPKAIWRVTGETQDGSFDFVSSEQDLIQKSFVTEYNFTFLEVHDYASGNNAMFLSDYDDSQWRKAIPAKPLDTDYQFCDCPADGVCQVIQPKEIGRTGTEVIYDCGVNISGYPVLHVSALKGERVQVIFSEELNADGTLNMQHCYGQKMVIENDGTEHMVHPLFTWFGFRYFSVEGTAKPEVVHVVHSKIPQIATFETDNELLNWIHDTYLNTQLCNMHAGIPSDCPHLERRGYTGDGQLTCHAAMTMLDAEQFYRKWIYDIADCQDVYTGHVQYTAPYLRSGGGPGGWGCAIVEVPYQYYRHYGDKSVLEDLYPAMLRYFDYLETHSEGHAIISDKEGEWCLGDWCTPKSVVLPAPYVNNYFYIKSLQRVIEISELLGKTDMIGEFQNRITERKKAIMSYYYNSWDGNFLGNQQGANAFAVDIGLGDQRTYDNLVAYYQQIGHYDTGIYGTDILTRVLFERGNGELALRLLLSEHQHSYCEMKRLGATTIWEYWPGSLRNRSHNHPMFGAIVAYFYEYIAGIRMPEQCNQDEIHIYPLLLKGIKHVKGVRKLPEGELSVEYRVSSLEAQFSIQIPFGKKAKFRFENTEYLLSGGVHQFRVPIKDEKERTEGE